MINKLTLLTPSDLCGVWIVRTFHLYGGFFRRWAKIGTFVKTSVRRTKSRNFVKKKKKSITFNIRTCYNLKKFDGSSIRFKKNNCILLKRRMTPRGDFIYGPIPKIVNRRKFIASFPGKI